MVGKGLGRIAGCVNRETSVCVQDLKFCTLWDKQCICSLWFWCCNDSFLSFCWLSAAPLIMTSALHHYKLAWALCIWMLVLSLRVKKECQGVVLWCWTELKGSKLCCSLKVWMGWSSLLYGIKAIETFCWECVWHWAFWHWAFWSCLHQGRRWWTLGKEMLHFMKITLLEF